MAWTGLVRVRVPRVPHPPLHARPGPARATSTRWIRRTAGTPTRCTSTASRTRRSTPSTSSASRCSRCTSATAPSSWLQSLGLRHPKYPDRPARPGARRWSCSSATWSRRPRCSSASSSSRGVMMKLDARIPGGPIEQKWSNAKFEMKLVNPANKRKYKVIVVGSGLAGGAAAATLAELGYDVACFCFQDSPRRAHSIAAQGGINAAKNYQNDGDSIHRLFYDTVKGGDFRSREANVHRLAEVSVDIIDQCAAMGVPFAREYGGTLANRSFGGAQVSRTFYARGQTGQQLLLGVYAALSRQIGAGKVKMFPRTEMLDVVVDERPRGRHRRARPRHRRDHARTRRTRSCSRPAATATCSTCRRTRRAATSPRPTARTSAAPGSRTRASRRSTRPASRSAGDYQSQADADVASRCATTAASGCRRRKDDIAQAPRPDRRRRARLLPRAQVPELRQPVAARHREPRREGAVRRRPRRRARRPRRLPRLPRRDQARRRGQDPREVRQPVRHVRADHRREPVSACRCASTRPSTTRWAGCGSTTTCRRRSPGCSASARRTSPTTARTGSAPAR